MERPLNLLDQLVREEGFKPHGYLDSEGYLTVGIGLMIDYRLGGGISLEDAKYLTSRRLTALEQELRKNWPAFDDLDRVRQASVLNMAYQLGVPRLMNFSKMLRALEAKDFSAAKKEALDSKWAKQTPVRAERVAEQLATGVWV